MQLQHPQQAHGFEHLRYEHLQAALQLDEEPTDLRVDLPVLWTVAQRGGGRGRGKEEKKQREG